MSRPFYITTPIYYVNDRPHIGHAYTTIAADMLARFHRLAGRDAFFLTGTDEHGTKIAEAAAKAGIAPQEFCDRVVATFVEAWKNLDINYNYFIRTTSPRHVNGVIKFVDAMRAARTSDGREVIYQDFYEGLYCNGCEKFLTEKELVDGLCPDHRIPPEKLREKNYFFRLTAFLDDVRKDIEMERIVILPEEKKNEVLGLIDQGLGDFSASRERVKWGIPLSFDKSQVAYVWVDALSNYITAIGYGDDPAAFQKWWADAEVVHLMGKEILKFHCLYWPAMLKAVGIKPPDTMFLHGWFTVDGNKMSKSLGNVIDPNDMVAQYGPDGARYLLMTQYPFGIDGDIQAKRFNLQYNSDLANDLGNLVSRVCKLLETNFDSRIPAPHRDLPGLQALIEQAEQLPGTAYGHIKSFRLTNAIAENMALVRSANKFFNDTAPWILAREGRTAELGGVLYACCEVIRIVSILLYPVMPRKMREIRAIFGLDDTTLALDKAQEFFDLVPGSPVRFEKAIFPRIESKEPKEEKSKSALVSGTPVTNTDGLIDIADFAKVELRVAQVLQAERIEGADKLLKLQVDLGKEKRQIVAGIALFYAPEALIGKRVVVVANLKPTVLRGVQSNGMLLAAKSGNKLALITPDAELAPGAKIS